MLTNLKPALLVIANELDEAWFSTDIIQTIAAISAIVLVLLLCVQVKKFRFYK